MEYHNSILCISGAELIVSEQNPKGVMPEGTYKSLSQRGHLRVIRRGCYNSPALVEYRSLPARYRERWEALNGKPETEQTAKTFLQLISTDAQAREAFTAYRYGDDGSRCLDVATIDDYCNAAAILNAVREKIRITTEARAKSGRKAPKLWEALAAQVTTARQFYACTLPSNAVSLKRKYERYVEEGYYALVHAGYGNRSAATINDPIGEALLLELLGNGNHLSAPAVAEAYNVWALANGRKAINERTVNNYKQEHDYQIAAARDGEKAWKNKYDKVIQRERPSAPLLLINSDDNDLDLYFKHEYTARVRGNVVTVRDDFFRFKMYVVIDAYCDYVLGYAIGEAMTVELVKEAYRNAAAHVKELTGGRYMWHQIVSDQWQHKALRPFYEAQATFTPPAVGLARSKVIERFFGNTWHAELKRYNNYAGQNITAKTKSNPDFIKENAKNRPSAEEGRHQVAQVIERLRSLTWKNTGQSRRQVWLDAFRKSAAARERVISEETYLMTFGCIHQLKGGKPAPERITNKGITPTIDGVTYSYSIPENVYRAVIGKTVNVYYDPADMSQVLATDGDRVRFVATATQAMPMAQADATPESRARLAQELATKKSRYGEVLSEAEARRIQLERAGIDAQSLLQAGVMIKEIKGKATQIAERMALGIQAEIDENTIANIM